MFLSPQSSIFLLLFVLLVVVSSLDHHEHNIDLRSSPFTVQEARNFHPAKRTPAQEEELTDEFVIHLDTGVDPVQIARENGLKFQECFQYSPQTCVFVQPATETREEHPNIFKLRAHPKVHWIERQVKRIPQKWSEERQNQYNLNQNPLYPSQWHLNNQMTRTIGQDVNIISAWNQGYTGRGVLIAIVDDSVEWRHPDLVASYVNSSSWDFNGNDWDSSPGQSSDNHGTSVAGVAAAGNNGACGVGGAFNANFSGIRLISGSISDKMVASALTYTLSSVHIYSNSWGYTSPFVGPLSNTLLSAFSSGVTTGRNGLGSIYSWAAGNDRTKNGNSNYDPFSAAPETISVAAVDNAGVWSWYSNPGSALLISAPSNGDVMGITTTDRQGANGYTTSDCNNNFGGTSSACPLVSGCVALMLEANPRLGWRDVQHILAKTARKNDPANQDWRINGAGLNVNHNYGFGVVDATGAVLVARSWVNVPPRKSTVYTQSTTTSIPDNPATPLRLNFVVTDDLIVEHVQVPIYLSHRRISSVQIQLKSPMGTVSRLLELSATTQQSTLNWVFLSTFCLGETAKGTWELSIIDTQADGNTGTVSNVQLKLWGYTGGSSTSVSVDISQYCSQGSFKVSWSQAIASTLVIKSTSNPSQPEIKSSVSGLTSQTFSNVNYGDYQAFLYDSQSKIVGSTIFTLPNCNQPTIEVQVVDCSKIRITWAAAPSATDIVLQEISQGAVMRPSSNIARSGTLDFARPYTGKWIAALSSNGQNLAQSAAFTGAVCKLPVITVTTDQQCSEPSNIIVKATGTLPGMTLTVQPQGSKTPVYSAADTTTTTEALVLQFPRPDVTGSWTAIVADSLNPLATQTFSVSSCAKGRTVKAAFVGCDSRGYGVMTVSWTGATSGDWVGISKKGSYWTWDWDYAWTEAGSVNFTGLPSATYETVMGDWLDRIVANTSLVTVSCSKASSVAPPKIKVKSVESTSVKLQLKSDTADIAYFQIRVSTDQKTFYEFQPFSSTSLTVTNLYPATTYYFQGKAGVETQNWGDWGEVVQVTTKKSRR